MTDEKFTKLSEEDLDWVVGGTKHKDCFMFKNENGNYSIIQFTCDLDDAAYKKVYDKASKGIQPDVEELGGNGSSLSRGIGGHSFDAYVKYMEDQGFSVHVK